MLELISMNVVHDLCGGSGLPFGTERAGLYAASKGPPG